MIDEAFDTEFEARLRATLDEMIPKLIASEIAVDARAAHGRSDVLVTRRARPVRGSRRLVGAVLAVAAVVVGLIVIAGRDTGGVVPGDSSSATGAGTPAWYDLIRPSLAERFPYVALTFATDVQLWFVAINPIEGKDLEIQLASGGYSAEPTTTIDATGEWVETAQGWSVRTPAGLFVSVSCDIGVGGRDYVGTKNYCDFTDGVLPYTKDEIRAVATSLATSLTVSIFDRDLGSPTGDAIDTAQATTLISAAVPGPQIAASDLGDGADHIYNVGAGVGNGSPSDTVPPLNAIPRADTSVRILHGVYPSPPVTGEPATALYDDAAVVSMIGSGGVVVRISTTDSSSESVTRLGQLARDLIALDPTAARAGSTPTNDTVEATTTTVEQATVLGTPVGTTTTLGSCAQSASPPVAVVVNASHVVGTAQWWTDNLAANVPRVGFARPVNAIAQEPNSRVMALDGYECDASLVAYFTTGAAVERATVQTLQALTAQPLPNGTSIVVVIGDDNLSSATTGVTTTIAPG